MDNASVNVHEVGDVFVAVVEVVSNIVRDWVENQWPGGDGFGGIPGVGVIEGVFCATELQDAKIVVVDEALEKVGIGRLGTHLDAATHTVEGHRDHGVARLPADRAVFCVVDNRPNAGLGLDEGLVSVSVILWREVVDLGVLVEGVGRVGFALGGRAVSDVVVIVGDLICGGQLIAGVVTILLVIDKHTATAKEGRSPL